MFDGCVEGFDGLAQQSDSAGEHGAGDHDGNLPAFLFEHLPDRKQTRLHVERVEAGFRQQQIAAAVHQAANLFGVRFDHLHQTETVDFPACRHSSRAEPLVGPILPATYRGFLVASVSLSATARASSGPVLLIS
jgi:hypothetical protein